MKEYKLTAVAALGAINDMKAIRGSLSAALNAVNRRERYGEQREGANYKVNPTFDVNETRAAIKEMLLDIDRAESALAAFNDAKGITQSLRKIREHDTRASESNRQLVGSILIFATEGDEIFPADTTELFGNFMDSLRNKRILKDNVTKNNNAEVTLQVENALLQEYLDSVM